jgi:hypothetical protein
LRRLRIPLTLEDKSTHRHFSARVRRFQSFLFASVVESGVDEVYLVKVLFLYIQHTIVHTVLQGENKEGSDRSLGSVYLTVHK